MVNMTGLLGSSTRTFTRISSPLSWTAFNMSFVTRLTRHPPRMVIAGFSTTTLSLRPKWIDSQALAVHRRSNNFLTQQSRCVSTKQRRRWKVRKYHFKLRLKRTMRKMRVPYVSSKPRGQVKKKPILYDFRPLLRRKLKRAER